MNLYYAIGGGLGHLTRAAAFLHQLQIENETAILASSKFAQDKRVVGEIEIIRVAENLASEREKYQKFLQKVLAENQIKKIFLDSFPVGIVGEFCGFDFQNIKVNYIARLLKWDKYLPLTGNFDFIFEQTFVLETLENEHQKFIDNFSKSITDFVLNYPSPKLSEPEEKTFREIIKTRKPFWLIVHSGDAEELLELVSYANDIREIENSRAHLILISPNKINSDKILQYDFYPASVLFESAERIFTGCGFNVMNQLKKFRHKHFFLPFNRRYDDQFARAKLASKNV